MSPRDPEAEEQQLIDEAVRARIQRNVPRAGGRRMDDQGWKIRPSDFAMIGGLIAIVGPLMAVAFYVRDIANQVQLVVREQAAIVRVTTEHETRLKSLEVWQVRFEGQGGQRQKTIDDLEARMRRQEGRP